MELGYHRKVSKIQRSVPRGKKNSSIALVREEEKWLQMAMIYRILKKQLIVSRERGKFTMILNRITSIKVPHPVDDMTDS